jgi:hypothetical protein
MKTRVFSAFNLARGVLLNCKLAIADNGHQPLKLLDIVISGMGMDATAGLWLTPLHAIPAVPRVFPFDLIYLDKDYRVLETAEMGPGIDFPTFRADVASALVLPSDTLRSSQTASSDRLIVCPASDLQTLLAASGVSQPSKAPELRAATLSATDMAGPPTIELTPERPLPGLSGPSLEHSILGAVAEPAAPAASAATVGLVEPPAPARNIQSDVKKIPEQSASGHQHEPLPPGPFLEIADAVFERPRKVQAAIIEHHVDPEDLFSNWIVSPSPGTRAERPSPAPPGAAPPKAAAPEVAAPARNGKQNGTGPSASANAPVEQSASTVRDNPAPVAKSKTTSREKLPTPSAPSVGIPQLPPASTFTAIPYGMWQVSLPTAVAPVLAPSQFPNQFSSKPVPATNGRNSAKQAKSVPAPPAAAKVADVSAEPTPSKPASPPAALKSEAATQVASSASAPKSQTATTSRVESEKLESAAKPGLADRNSAEMLAPGDFLASLQRKLEKIQRSKPATVPPSEHANEGSLAAGPPKSSSPAATPLVQPATTNSNLRSKPAPSPTQPKAKIESLPGGLRSKFKHWLNPVATPSDRRRALRRYVPGMVAHYFTGGAPKPKDVADISMSGMYLLTDDRWMPGTMIQMTLQKPCAQGERKQSMNVLSRIVRRGSDGVAIEFIMPEALSHISHDIQPSQATDKVSLARFL